jgi:hypothetical protein
MAQRDLHADAYQDSGRSAAGQRQLRMKVEALNSSIKDANELEQRGLLLIRRSARMTRLACAVTMLPVIAGVALGAAASNSFDGTHEGVLLANWAILGCFVCVGGLAFASTWYSNVRRLRETGKRLMTRAEYQRRLASLRLSEIEHETVR